MTSEPDGTGEAFSASGQVGRLTLVQALVRGVRIRCPVCGRSKLFRNMFQMHANCKECGFRFERAPGYFLGSTYINYGFTAFITTASYVVLHFGFGVGNESLLPGLMVFCLFFPLVFFRYARSLWLAADCFIDRVVASETMSEADRNKSDQEV